jgi:ABC-2 type transport system ATP-binding protein
MTDKDLVITIRDARKRFRGGIFRRDLDALRGVSFEVQRGTIFALLGPNGAGKTTLIKILLGIIQQWHGSATLLGQPVGNRRCRKAVGYLPENLKLARHHSAHTALGYFGRLSGLTSSEIRQRRPRVLEMVGLRGREKESVRRFSKGMQQRLGLAQAMMHDPELLILDEPTDGLDPVGRSQVRATLQQLRDEGHTVFLNSHLLQEVELICDRVAILDAGQLKFVGTLDELTPHQHTAIDLELVGNDQQVRDALHPLKVESHLITPAGIHRIHAIADQQYEIDALIDRLRQRRISILRLTRRRKTLEDAFLDLIAVQAEVA